MSGTAPDEQRPTRPPSRTLAASGVLGVLSTAAYLVDASAGDLWYDRPVVGVVLPLVVGGLAVWIWLRPGRRRVGRVVAQYAVAVVCWQASLVLGLPFLVASSLCLLLRKNHGGDVPTDRTTG